METLTPRQVVKELDKYIIGQEAAKKAVAIALRNRWRRQQLAPDLRDEVAPKNIIMIGPTGVGKTEIARRLAQLARSPFLKVEASKFTEVGYVGRDVESMVRDLTEIAKNQVREERTQEVQERARTLAEEHLLNLLLPPPPSRVRRSEDEMEPREEGERTHYEQTRERFRSYLRQGRLDERFVEIEVSERSLPTIEVITGSGIEDIGIDLKDMLGGLFPQKKQARKVRIPEAVEILTQEEVQKLLDMDAVIREAIDRVEQSGIIVLDEIDKIAGRETTHGPDVSREGVQRDLLPIVEGSTVVTKYGMVKTDHVLFIAAGAFHSAKPSDLIPELQGRFPIRVELQPLTREDFVEILTKPKNALRKQYTALLETEGIYVELTDDAIEEIATLAEQVNEAMENIGARRLHTIMEKLFEDVSFEGPDNTEKEIVIDAAYVREKLSEIVKDQDLSRYIL